MFTVSLITAPANANLESALLDGLSRSWDGGTPRWLNPGIAGEFDIGTMPTDVDQVWSDLQTIGIDMAIQPPEVETSARPLPAAISCSTSSTRPSNSA